MSDSLPAPRWVAATDADAWRAEALDWLNAGAATAGLTRTGPIVTTKRRPWSLVAEVPTSAGPVWFKANVPAQGHEAALLDRLSRLVPGSVPTPLAAHPERCWLLLPDHGPTVRGLARDADPSTWTELVGQWSAVARALAASSRELEQLGVPSLRPEDGSDYLSARIAESGLPPAAAQRLRGIVPILAAAGDCLAELGLPLTLWHNDLHTHNVFAPDPDGRLVYFDFGDALIGSALGELLIPLRSFADARGVELSPRADVLADPHLSRIVDAAIEPWTDLATSAQLRRAVPAALLIGVLGRSESWRRALTAVDAEGRVEFGDASTAWLTELLPD